MQFNFIVGNPPYQEKKIGNTKSNKRLWMDIIVHVSKNLQKDGLMAMVHPSGWRNDSNYYAKARNLYTTWDLVHLGINNSEAGKRVFNAGTRFDVCVVKNSSPTYRTSVKDEDGQLGFMNIHEYKVIPNLLNVDLTRWMGGGGGFGYSHTIYQARFGYSRTSYGTNTSNMRSVPDEEFNLPCINNVGKKNDITNFWYSNVDKGMFGVPKVVFGRFGTGVYIDREGKYGVAHGCAYIEAPPEELEQVRECLQSEEFQRMLKAVQVGSNGSTYEFQFMKLLKKDFWKH
jgi:hypothetical protein